MEEKSFIFAGIEFLASSGASLFHAESNTLIVSDCHFGKTFHFRKNNIPIPQAAAMDDYHNLYALLDHYQPHKCIFLGDLFHSSDNPEWQWVKQLRREHKHIAFILVQGNHDILSPELYKSAGFQVFNEIFFQERILLTHEPLENPEVPNLCGHLHPGFTLYGKARQAVSMPCFYIAENTLFMPAFGNLTGHINMDRKYPGGNALCIAGDKLIWVNQPLLKKEN